MDLDAGRLAGLARTKLEGLVRRAFPDVTRAAEGFNAGVGLYDHGRAFVLLIADAPSPLAAALAWGERKGATELHVIVDEVDPTLPLAAAGLDPEPMIWRAVGTELIAVRAEAVVAPPLPPAVVMAQVPILEGAGCDVVIEHGVVIGEVLGLEVARVATEVDGSATIRVGVGLYDQEAHALMHAGSSVEERLGQVGAEVRHHRRADVGPHPINRVARERWLRSIVCADPGLIGLDSLVIEAPLIPRGGIREERPVAARGRAGATDVLVMCSTGIDLDLVPTAAAHLGRETADEVVLVLPARDHHPIIEKSAGRLSAPARLVAVTDPWP